MYQQQPLPGAYYGPAVPPQQQQERKSRDCFCCLFGTAVRIFIAVMVLLCILALVLWLIFRPSEIKVHVTSASLTQFNFTTLAGDSRSLDYNLSTVLTIRNPNERVGIYYDYLDAGAYYDGQRFGWQVLPTFYQGHKDTTTLDPAFSGRSVISLSGTNVNDFELQRRAGALDVTLRLRGRIRFKIGSSLKTSRTTLYIDCNLAVPYSPNGAKTGRIFSETRCRVDW